MIRYFQTMPADTPDDILARARLDYELGRISGEAVLEAAGAIVELTGGASLKDELERKAETLEETERDRDEALWQLKVALAAVNELRKTIGEFHCEIAACVGRLSSSLKPPSDSEKSEYDEKCNKVLEKLAEVAEGCCLRPNRDDDFRSVAERFDLLDERPD